MRRVAAAADIITEESHLTSCDFRSTRFELYQLMQRGTPSLLRERAAENLKLKAGPYFTFAKMMANVYSAIDSISTSASRSANRIGAAAPGLRARPSQAEDVARA